MAGAVQTVRMVYRDPQMSQSCGRSNSIDTSMFQNAGFRPPACVTTPAAAGGECVRGRKRRLSGRTRPLMIRSCAGGGCPGVSSACRGSEVFSRSRRSWRRRNTCRSGTRGGMVVGLEKGARVPLNAACRHRAAIPASVVRLTSVSACRSRAAYVGRPIQYRVTCPRHVCADCVIWLKYEPRYLFVLFGIDVAVEGRTHGGSCRDGFAG
jgi:hypothetical protein